MNTRVTAILFLTAIAGFGRVSDLAAQVTPVTPVTTVTYQGRLHDGPAPANGLYDFTFTIFNANGLLPLTAPLTNAAVPVSNGLFTAQLHFDPDLWVGPGSNARLLEVAVRSAGGGAFTPLSPRHPITAVPFALKALDAKVSSLSAPDGTPADVLSVDDSGNVGIGTSNPEFPLDVAGPVRITSVDEGAEILNLSTERSWAFRQLGSGATTALELASIGGGGNKNLIINTTGFVGIGTTDPGFNLHVNGTAGKSGGGSWAVASDKRLKKNIRPLAGALDRLLALHGVSFEYIDPAKIHELSGERMGLVAQEVEKVFPDWVETGADGYKRVTVRGLEALVVEALRELRQEQEAKRAEDLKRRDAENAELKRGMDELKTLVNALTCKLNGVEP